MQILRNPLYRGEWQYGKVKVERIDTLDGIKRHAERRNEGKIPVNVPPIVDRWLWDAVQEQLAENRRKFYRPPQREYLLRGRVRCALCGGMLIGGCIKRASGKLYIKYVCRRASGEYAYDPNCCHAGVLNGEVAERAVWHAIRDAMLEPDRLWVGVKQRRDEERKARRIITSALAAIERGDIEDNARLDRLLDLYTSGDIDKERYLSKRSSLKDQIAKRKEEHSALAARLSEHNVLTDEQIDDLRMFQAEIAGRMSDNVPPADKMRLLDLLRIECVYNSNTKELAITGLMGNTLLSVTSA